MTRAVRPLAFAALALAALLALLLRPALAQVPELASTGPDWLAVADDWLVRVGVGLALGIPAWPRVRGWLGLDREERRAAASSDEQPITRGELRQAVTDAAQALRAEVSGVRAEGEGQHRRLRETLAGLDTRMERIDARITTWQHDTAEHRVTLARELGQIGVGIETLRRQAEERL